MKNIFSFCCIYLLISIPAPSQIINAEGERMKTDTIGWKGSLGLDMTFIQNTEKIFGIDAEARLQYKTSNDRGLWLILGSYGFLKAGEEEHISNAYLHLRYNRKINHWLRWEFFGQFQNNAITQIDSRFLAGTGPRFKIIKWKHFRMYAGCLFMFEKEKEKTVPVITHNDWRNSSYVSFTWTPKENIELISTTYYQPLLKQISDYRILNQIGFKINATPHFGMEIKLRYLHDRFPAGDSPRSPYSFSTGFAYDF